MASTDTELVVAALRLNGVSPPPAALTSLPVEKRGSRMAQEFFKLPDGQVVSFNPKSRWHGWILSVGRDGQLIPQRQLASYSPVPGWIIEERTSSGKGD